MKLNSPSLKKKNEQNIVLIFGGKEKIQSASQHEKQRPTKDSNLPAGICDTEFLKG